MVEGVGHGGKGWGMVEGVGEKQLTNVGDQSHLFHC